MTSAETINTAVARYTTLMRQGGDKYSEMQRADALIKDARRVLAVGGRATTVPGYGTKIREYTSFLPSWMQETSPAVHASEWLSPDRTQAGMTPQQVRSKIDNNIAEANAIMDKVQERLSGMPQATAEPFTEVLAFKTDTTPVGPSYTAPASFLDVPKTPSTPMIFRPDETVEVDTNKLNSKQLLDFVREMTKEASTAYQAYVLSDLQSKQQQGTAPKVRVPKETAQRAGLSPHLTAGLVVGGVVIGSVLLYMMFKPRRAAPAAAVPALPAP